MILDETGLTLAAGEALYGPCSLEIHPPGKLRLRIQELEAVLKASEQMCVWLSQDSNKYPGTDAGNAARSLLVDIRRAMEGK